MFNVRKTGLAFPVIAILTAFSAQAAPDAPSGGHGMTDEQIISRQNILDAVRDRLDRKLKTVDESLLDENNHVETKKILSPDAMTRLLRIYSNMKPRDAAPIFDVMDMHVLVALSASMNTRKLAAIMALMSQDRANMITQYVMGLRRFRHDESHDMFIYSVDGTDKVSLNRAGENATGPSGQ